MVESPTEGDAAEAREDQHRPHHVRPEHRELLRRLTLNDEHALELVAVARNPGREWLLDHRTRSLLRIAGVIAMDPEDTSLQTAVDHAYHATATDSEIVDTVLALVPVVGAKRIAATLPRLASMLDTY